LNLNNNYCASLHIDQLRHYTYLNLLLLVLSTFAHFHVNVECAGGLCL